jgi:hypothetical protein
MSVLILQVFVSLMLVLSSVLLFAYSVRYRDHEHADRLALFPLEDDSARPAPRVCEPPPPSDSSR